MRILLIDQPLYNRGDESALKGLIRNLIKVIPDIEITVLEINAPQAAINEFDLHLSQVNFVNLIPVNSKWYNRFVNYAQMYHVDWLYHFLPTIRKVCELYKQVDFVIMAPGGINLGGFQDWRHLFLLSLAYRMDKPLIYYGRSIGPFPAGNWKQKRFRHLAYKILNYCSFVCLRDEKSISVAKELEVKCIQTVDSAFLDSTEVSIPNQVREMIGNSKYIVYVPNELIWHYMFRDVNASEINRFFIRLFELIQNHYPDYKIVMLPQTNNQKRNDYSYFKELRDISPYQKNIVIIPDTYSSDVQQAIIKNAILMVGARYHSIVFAINQGIPFISLSYEHKMSGLLEVLKKTNRMIDITKIFKNDLEMESALSHFESQVIDLVKSENAQQEAKEIASKCFGMFCKTLLMKV